MKRVAVGLVRAGFIAALVVAPARQDCGCGGCPTDQSDPNAPGPRQFRGRAGGDFRMMEMDPWYSPNVPDEAANRIFDEGKEFFNATWGRMGEVAYRKLNPNPNPTYDWWDLKDACWVELGWRSFPRWLTLPAGQSAAFVVLYWHALPQESGSAIQIHTDAYDILAFNGIDQTNPAYILYPEMRRIHAVTEEVTVPQGLGAWTLGPALKNGIGEGSVWQRSAGTTGGSQGPDVQALLDVIGPAHELLHLVGRTIHFPDPVYPGDRPDTAWYQLYSPSMGGMGGTQGTGNKAWNGRFGGSAAMLNDLPYAQPPDAEKWMVVSWVEDFGGGQVRSQCQFMRDDPKGYLQSLVF